MMSLPLYGKENWTEADVLALVQDGEEGWYLEFKRPPALTDHVEIGRDASAFANADGGTIIYGIAEKKKPPHEIDLVDPSIKSKESLEQIIDSNVRPMIRGVRVSVVHSSSGDGCFYIVDIPKATTFGPHQTLDGKYYRRQNTSRYAMPHYEIMEIARRVESPLLFVDIQAPMGKRSRVQPNIQDAGHSNYFHFDWLVENDSEAVCENAVIELYIDERCLRYGFNGFTIAENMMMKADVNGSQYKALLTRIQLGWRLAERMPLFRGLPTIIGDGALAFPSRFENVPYFVTWRCRAPRMTPQTGAFSITNTRGDFRVEAIASENVTLTEA